MPGNSTFLVHWKSRVLFPNKEMRDGVISRVKQGGFELTSDRAAPIGSEIAIEFYVKYRDKPNRIRAKASVTYCRITSNGDSLIRLTITQIGREENHTLNNVLQAFAESDSFDLRV